MKEKLTKACYITITATSAILIAIFEILLECFYPITLVVLFAIFVICVASGPSAETKAKVETFLKTNCEVSRIVVDGNSEKVFYKCNDDHEYSRSQLYDKMK
jgi:D-alanyl-D-alanine carboxypeptidase